MAGEYDKPLGLDRLRLVAASGQGVPLIIANSDDVYARARIVRNTVEPDPDMPTLAEVREILDAPIEDGEVTEQVVADE